MTDAEQMEAIVTTRCGEVFTGALSSGLVPMGRLSLLALAALADADDKLTRLARSGGGHFTADRLRIDLATSTGLFLEHLDECDQCQFFALDVCQRGIYLKNEASEAQKRAANATP